MQAHGLAVPEGYVVEGRYDDIMCTKRRMLSLLDRVDPPTCILLPDDASYFGAMEAANERGFKLGQDISVAGYDGIRLTQSLHPRLTTVFQDSESMGRQAAQRLIDRVEHPNTAPNGLVMIPVRLIEGETMAKLIQ